MSPQTWAARSPEQSRLRPTPSPLPLPQAPGKDALAPGRHPSPLLGTCQPRRSRRNWLGAPQPRSSSPAPASSGRCEGSDFTACQLRPKNTQHAELPGRGRRARGPGTGRRGARVTWPKQPSGHHSLLGRDGQRSPGPPLASELAVITGHHLEGLENSAVAGGPKRGLRLRHRYRGLQGPRPSGQGLSASPPQARLASSGCGSWACACFRPGEGATSVRGGV